MAGIGGQSEYRLHRVYHSSIAGGVKAAPMQGILIIAQLPSSAENRYSLH
jgi:hypothetical protein